MSAPGAKRRAPGRARPGAVFAETIPRMVCLTPELPKAAKGSPLHPPRRTDQPDHRVAIVAPGLPAAAPTVRAPLATARQWQRRARVEHPFRVIKPRFGHVKTRYRGLARNRARIFTLFALGTLFLVRRRLLA